MNINDKHIETIARQMMRWVKIEDVGDTEFLVDEQVDKIVALSVVSEIHRRRARQDPARNVKRASRCAPARRTPKADERPTTKHNTLQCIAMRSLLLSLAATLVCTVGCSGGNKPASETAPASAPPPVSPSPSTAAGGVLANDSSAAVALQCAQTARDVPGNQGTSWYMRCPASCAEERLIWGTDIYTDDSSVCRAAVHAQAISASQGGAMLVTWGPAQATYVGSTRNGVTSNDYGAWGRSFFVQAVDASGKPTSPAAVPLAAGNARLSCRHAGGALTGEVGKTWRVSCPAGCGHSGSVWGTDVYTSDSPVCQAAIHAGVIAAAGGDATLTVDGPQTSFHGSAQNGITSQDYGAYASSYRLAK